jgi:hypothetical protein
VPAEEIKPTLGVSFVACWALAELKDVNIVVTRRPRIILAFIGFPLS